MTTFRKLLLVMLLLVGMLPNVSGLLTPATASDLPCYDMWEACGGSEEYCDGVWCGCMGATYGYQCDAQLNSGGGDHRSIEESLAGSRQ